MGRKRERDEELLKLLAEQARRSEQNPLRYLKPHRQQQRFLESQARIRLFLGGNQSGKTTAGWMEAIAHAYGYRFWEVEDLRLIDAGKGKDLPPREQVPSEYWIRNAANSPIRIPNVGFVVTGLAARRGIGETIFEKFKEIWPRSCPYRTNMMMAAVPESLQFPNGSRIIFGSGEQQELSTEGVTLDYCWCDEPIPQRIYTGLWRGLVRNMGRIWFTLTPLGSRAAWLYQDFIAPREDERRVSVEYIEVSMSQNPHLSSEAVQDFANDPSFSEAEKQARLFGKFEHLSHRVWPRFEQRSPYVVEPFHVPRDWRRVHVVDPHSARPWAMIWLAISPSGIKFVYREWPEVEYVKLKSSNKTIRDYAMLIRSLEGRDQVEFRVIDPNYGIQRRRHLGYIQSSIQEEIAEFGLEFDEMVDDSLERGIAVVGDALNYDTRRPITIDNSPRLVIFDHCKNTITALSNFSYKESKDPQRRSEDVSDEFKDFADCVRYALVYDYPSLDDAGSYLEEE